ncbi:hypothetical protein Tco_0718192, partial [Tanacetum coccineum]
DNGHMEDVASIENVVKNHGHKGHGERLDVVRNLIVALGIKLHDIEFMINGCEFNYHVTSAYYGWKLRAIPLKSVGMENHFIRMLQSGGSLVKCGELGVKKTTIAKEFVLSLREKMMLVGIDHRVEEEHPKSKDVGGLTRTKKQVRDIVLGLGSIVESLRELADLEMIIDKGDAFVDLCINDAVVRGAVVKNRFKQVNNLCAMEASFKKQKNTLAQLKAKVELNILPWSNS